MPEQNFRWAHTPPVRWTSMEPAPPTPHRELTVQEATALIMGDGSLTPPDTDEESLRMRPTSRDNIPGQRRTCTNCNRLGHLERTCTRTRGAIAKIGVEVEGWWFDLNGAKVVAERRGMSGTLDGSLHHDESGETEAYEFRTRPGTLGNVISQVVEIYPDKCDPSAGMHIHTSFRDESDVTILATWPFVEYYRERWKAWGERMGIHRSSDFWSRLRGQGDYCRLNMPSDLTDRVFMQGGDRYRQLNYTAWRRHRTIENRMLPLFRDARMAVAAIEEHVAIIEDFIALYAESVLARLAHDHEIDCSDLDGEHPVAIAVTETREIELDWSNHVIGLTGNVDISSIAYDQHRGTIETGTLARSVETGIVLPAPVNECAEATVPLLDSQPRTPGAIRVFGQSAFRRAIRDFEAQQGWY